jgi:betaine lipid synthase
MSTAMMSLSAVMPRDPYYLIALSIGIVGLFLATIFVTAFKPQGKPQEETNTLQAYLKFFYACFVKPHTGDGTGSQQDALVSFSWRDYVDST